MNTILLTILATFFTFLLTVLGSAVVFAFRKVNKTILDAMIGFAGGIMISASFFSLLKPAISMGESLSINTYYVCTFGFISGGLFLFICDKVFNKYLSKKNTLNHSSLKRCFMLILSITIHNIPEGMAIGVAFGGSSIIAAIMLTIGIGIQNFPEGTAVSLPLKRDGMSSKNAFLLGGLSGVVEIPSGLIGVLLVLKIQMLLPYLLSLAAGAMIYVVVLELIPESQSNKKRELMALFTLIGFTIMMFLDIAFG